MSAEFVVNNKIYMATKILPFRAKYGRELRIGGDIRRTGKVEKAMEFVERMKQVQEEARAVLKKAQEDMKSKQIEEERKVKNRRKKIE